jgi:hypothetical protein
MNPANIARELLRLPEAHRSRFVRDLQRNHPDMVSKVKAELEKLKYAATGRFTGRNLRKRR